MKPSEEMNEELDLAEKRITKIQTVIDFEKEPKIRHKAFQLEERLRDIFSQPALVYPVPESESEGLPRVVFPGPESCTFSQVKIDYVVEIPKDKGKEVDRVLTETGQKALRIFTAFQEETGRHITRMGIIATFILPLLPGKSSVNYLHQTFFKADFAPEKLTGLDFHYAQEADDKYNINWFIRALKPLQGTEKDALSVSVDINNYLEQRKKKTTAYPEEVVKELFGFMTDYIKAKADAAVRNEFTLE